MSSPPPTLFVTVGTTQFEACVRAACAPAFARAARARLGPAARVLLQVGRGAFAPPAGAEAAEAWRASAPEAGAGAGAGAGGGSGAGAGADSWRFRVAGVAYEAYRFKATLAADVASAALVVSHAGAGSVFEALRARKPLLVVVNKALADNHQLELARALAAAGEGGEGGGGTGTGAAGGAGGGDGGGGELLRGPFLAWCEPEGLAAALAALDAAALRPLPPARTGAVVAECDRLLGFA